MTKDEAYKLMNDEALLRAAITCDFEACLKVYESALIRNDPNADEYRRKAHDIVDNLMDSQVRAVGLVKQIRF